MCALLTIFNTECIPSSWSEQYKKIGKYLNVSSLIHDLGILVSATFRDEYFGKAEHLSIHSFCSQMLGAFSNFQLLKSSEKKRNIYALHNPTSFFR